MLISVSQKAMTKLESLPVTVQAKVRSAVEYIKSSNERSLKPVKLKGGRGLYSGRVNSKYRLIYAKRKGCITLIDIIQVDEINNVMRSEP